MSTSKSKNSEESKVNKDINDAVQGVSNKINSGLNKAGKVANDLSDKVGSATGNKNFADL